MCFDLHQISVIVRN